MSFYYSKEHEWLREEDEENVVSLGISSHAADELGDITFVELPEIGKTYDPGETLAVVESVKAASDVYAPVGGTVVEVNEELEDAPETINASAEGDGWICKLKLDAENVQEMKKLMSQADYDAYIKE